VFGQKKRIAHRDIKPRNILVTEARLPKLADYGIAKLLDRAGAWAPAKGHTFRFDYTPGYTPAEPDQHEYSFARDCYSFAAVAATCLTGRILTSEEDQGVAMQEAALPPAIRPLLERCLSKQAAQRPPLASVLLAGIERVEEDLQKASTPVTVCHLALSTNVQNRIGILLGREDRKSVEQFIVDELGEASALLLPENVATGEEIPSIDIVGVTWRFRARIGARHTEILELIQRDRRVARNGAPRTEFRPCAIIHVHASKRSGNCGPATPPPACRGRRFPASDGRTAGR